MNRIGRRLRREWVSRRLKRHLDKEPLELTRLGTDHGGWVLPAKTVDAGGVAVCVGAGEDISFDVELNKRGFQVYTLDPTPRAKRHVEELLDAVLAGAQMAISGSKSNFYDLFGFDMGRFRYLDVGVWEDNTTMRFFSPRDKSHVSHSIVNLQKTEEYFEAKCMTVESLCEQLNLREFTLLKMDVEGAEYAVLRNLVKRGPRPEVLCVEFDEIRNPLDDDHPERIAESVDLLKRSGYKFAHLENSNALFVRSN
jgi:Methyltransferase FkbM domain